jgi:hypothetical protein
MRHSPTLTLLFLLLFTPLSHAAQFDIWETGMTLNEIVQVSKQHDIPISQSGVFGVSKGFNKKLLNERFWKASNVGYITKLIGMNAKVELLLSPEWPNSVYEIQVRFAENGAASQEFKGELLNMLTEKYGRPQRTSKLLHKAYRWKQGKSDEVLLTMLSFPILSYTDVEFKEYVEKIRGYKHKNEVQGLTQKDTGKF